MAGRTVLYTVIFDIFEAVRVKDLLFIPSTLRSEPLLLSGENSKIGFGDDSAADYMLSFDNRNPMFDFKNEDCVCRLKVAGRTNRLKTKF